MGESSHGYLGMNVTLKIPRRLESPNTWQGRHWTVKNRLTQEWQAELVYGEWTRFRGHRRISADQPELRRVLVERHVPSRRNFIRDDDNLRFAVKPLLDALKRQGYIYDDSRKWLDHPTPTQYVSADGKDWTIVTVEIVK